MLDDYKCPKCGQRDNLYIVGLAWLGAGRGRGGDDRRAGRGHRVGRRVRPSLSEVRT